MPGNVVPQDVEFRFRQRSAVSNAAESYSRRHILLSEANTKSIFITTNFNLI